MEVNLYNDDHGLSPPPLSSALQCEAQHRHWQAKVSTVVLLLRNDNDNINFGRKRIQAFHNPNSLLVPFWNPNSQTFSILSLSAVFLGATQILDSNALP